MTDESKWLKQRLYDMACADIPAAVTVKPLSWLHFDGNYPKWTTQADVWGGSFTAKIDKGEPNRFGIFPVFINGTWDGKLHRNLKSAKAAVNNAYKKQLALSGVNITPAPVAQPGAVQEAVNENARDRAAAAYIGVVSTLRDEPEAFKRQCFRDGWNAAMCALKER